MIHTKTNERASTSSYSLIGHSQCKTYLNEQSIKHIQLTLPLKLKISDRACTVYSGQHVAD